MCNHLVNQQPLNVVVAIIASLTVKGEPFPLSPPAQQANGSILHLYRLKSGSCESSYATAVARAAGIDESTAKRSEEVLACLRGGRAIARNPGVYQEDAYVAMAESFLNLDLGDDSGLAGYLMKLRKMNIC